MDRVDQEHDYWNENAQDPEVDIKYISDRDVKLCKKDLGELKGKVLEVGCGVGRLMEDGWYGIDISENMLEIAQKRNNTLKLFQSDGRLIPFDDDFFDNVYCYLVFQHLQPDAVEVYIDEIHRVLKKGGTFTFQFIQGTEREPYSNHYTLEEIKRLTTYFESGKTFQSHAEKNWTIGRYTK